MEAKKVMSCFNEIIEILKKSLFLQLYKKYLQVVIIQLKITEKPIVDFLYIGKDEIQKHKEDDNFQANLIAHGTKFQKIITN